MNNMRIHDKVFYIISCFLIGAMAVLLFYLIDNDIAKAGLEFIIIAASVAFGYSLRSLRGAR